MSAIKKGDLVMVVRPKPCCGRGRCGHIFTAGDVIPSWTGTILCQICGTLREISMMVQAGNKDEYCELARLIRIDPPSTSETTEAYRNVPNREIA